MCGKCSCLHVHTVPTHPLRSAYLWNFQQDGQTRGMCTARMLSVACACCEPWARRFLFICFHYPSIRDMSTNSTLHSVLRISPINTSVHLTSIHRSIHPSINAIHPSVYICFHPSIQPSKLQPDPVHSSSPLPHIKAIHSPGFHSPTHPASYPSTCLRFRTSIHQPLSIHTFVYPFLFHPPTHPPILPTFAGHKQEMGALSAVSMAAGQLPLFSLLWARSARG